jgi:F-type H+-transporting ATPase subunit a
MEHKLIISEWVNKFLHWLLALVGVDTKPGHDVIPGHVVMALIVTLIIVVFFKLTVKNLSMLPSKLQRFLEMIYQAFRSLIDDIIGPEGRQYLPAIATIGIFIAMCNLVGLLPEMGSPTANLNVTVGCALFIFVYYHYQGVRKHGALGYIKTFMGPAWWLAWLFFPIEIISHFSRPLSLSMRLFGNIYGEDLVIYIIMSIAPWYLFISPLPMMAFAIFTSFLQAFIFVMLSIIYLGGAVSSEH